MAVVAGASTQTEQPSQTTFTGHRSDQCYLYDWEKFANVNELNQKLKTHSSWSYDKPMRILGRKSPLELFAASLGSYH